MRVKRMPEFPPRPYIPPLFFCVVGCAALSMLLLENSWEQAKAGTWCGISIAFPVVVSLLAVLACAVAACVRRRYDLEFSMGSLGLAFACFIALICSLSIWTNAVASQIREVKGTASSYMFEVIGDSSLGERGYSFTALARRKDGNGPTFRVRVTGEKMLTRGERFYAVGSFSPLGDSDWARSRFFKGEVACLSLRRCYPLVEDVPFDIVQTVRRHLLDRFAPSSSPEGSLAAGVLCGYTTDLNRWSIREDFAACGLSHLIAVSGSHLAIVAALVQNVWRRAGAGFRKTRILMLIACCFYTILTGAAPSTIRSVCMVACTGVSAQAGRRSHALSSLSLTLMIMLILWPNLVFDLGFQLSALSVASILIFGRYASYALHSLRLPSFMAEGMAITLTAQIATTPLTSAIFGQVSLVAPVANILVTPLISVLLTLGVAALPFFWIPGLAGIVTGLLYVCSRAILFLASTFAAIPFASLNVSPVPYIWPLFLTCAVLLYLLWLRPSRRMVLAVFSFIAAAASIDLVYWGWFAPAQITVLDVGQADSILIRDGDSCILVDAGVDDTVLEALAAEHVLSLDAVVVTHWDKDHYGGLCDIASRYPVGNVIVAQGAALTAPSEVKATGLELVEVEQGDSIHVGRFDCVVLWPTEIVDGDDNEDSLVVLARYREGPTHLSMLLTGDSEVDQECEYASMAGDIDVLKLGHHGSAKSVDGPLLEALAPEVAIASAGAHNSYGHPASECVAAIQNYGTRFYCTIDDGSVSVFPDARGIRVHCTGSKGGALE